jgi:hypothetical protein
MTPNNEELVALGKYDYWGAIGILRNIYYTESREFEYYEEIEKYLISVGQLPEKLN